MNGVEYLNLFEDPNIHNVMPTWEIRFSSLMAPIIWAFYFVIIYKMRFF